MLNVVALQGRLTADPELKKTQSGVSVISFTIACDRNFCKQGEERQCDFIRVRAWRGLADWISKYFTKGQMICIDGSIQTGSYEDKEGRRVNTFEVVAQNANFAGEKKSAQTSPRTVPQDESGLNVVPEDFAVVDEAGEDLPF